MDESFPTQEYIEDVILGISKYTNDYITPWIVKPMEQGTRSKPIIITDEREIFELWLKNQLLRYEKVKEIVEPFMKSKNMILPAEKFDFMKWFVNKARKTNNYRDVKIEDYHFIEYHEERMMGMNKSAKWVEFYNELSDAGYISTNVEIFDYVMKHKRRPSDKDKIQWLTFKADALDIRSQFGFSMKKFNNCFVSKDGRPFTLGSQTDYNPERNKELSTIIKKYKLIS